MADVGERLENIRRLRMWTQVRLAREAGVSPTTVSAIETGKIGRPHFGTLDKLARALRVAPEELQGSRAAMEGPRALSMGWARDSEEGEFKRGLEGASSRALTLYLASWTQSRSVFRGSMGSFPKLASRGDS